MNQGQATESTSEREVMVARLRESDGLFCSPYRLLRMTEEAKHQAGACETINARVLAEEMALLKVRMKSDTAVAVLEGPRLVAEQEERVAECPMRHGEELEVASPIG